MATTWRRHGDVLAATWHRNSTLAPYAGRVEDLDRQIVALLSADGRTSFTDLGKATGLSTSAVHQRVRRLEERGVIRGYRAVVDHDKVGLSLTAIIFLSPFDPAAPDDIPDRLNHIEQIESCYSVAGEQSYILLVRLTRPVELEELLGTIRSVANCSTRSTVVLSTSWEDRPVAGPAEASAS